MISLDCETTGLDPWHGSEPFLVTICNEKNEISYWEWDVDPLTRKVQVPQEDVREIERTIHGQEIVLQNSKFDVRMLETLDIGWDWSLTHDTLVSSHLLNSSRPKDLTSSVLFYLDIDLQSYEEKLKKIVSVARRIAKKHFPSWHISEKGLSDMPSTKEKTWKSDLWLPRAIVKGLEKVEGVAPQLLEEIRNDRDWATVTRDYANSDSESTLLLFQEQSRLLEERGHWNIYLWKLKGLQIAYEMEDIGVTLHGSRLDELEKVFRQDSIRAGRVCTGIAKGIGYDLDLPKSGNNGSLTRFVFDHLKLDVLKVSEKTDKPSMDKEVIEQYKTILPPRSKGGRFINSLSAKRSRDTALSYMESYRRFMLPLSRVEHWFTLHPSLNVVGTRTLRWSSKNPNEQNISKLKGFNLRYAFGPAPGREWWSLDYNNLELRIPAYECQEPAMLELFENPSNPPYFGSYHLLVFDILYPDLFEKYGAEVRDRYKSTLYQYTKNGNFAELYGAVDITDLGIGDLGTADRAFHYPGAQSMVANRLRKKSELNRQWIAYARKHGYVETTPDKTVDANCGYPLYCPKNKYGQVRETIPLNYHVQGTACWVIQSAMVKVQKYLSFLPGYYMIMQIHDELVLDFPYRSAKGNLPKVNKVRLLMESCGNDIDVPLTCGIDYHPDNWGTAV